MKTDNGYLTEYAKSLLVILLGIACVLYVLFFAPAPVQTVVAVVGR